MARPMRQRPPEYEWFGPGVSSVLGLAAGAQAQAIGLAFTDSLTIRRTRGEVMVWLDGTADVGDCVAVTVGLRVVPTVDVGDNSVLPGQTEGEWFWQGAAVVAVESATAIGDSVARCARIQVDSKAMRRCKPGQSVQFSVLNTTVGTAQAVNVVGIFSILLSEG